MREHKTWTDGEEGFDNAVNKFVAEGWEVDSKAFGVNKDGNIFIAFLSRAMPEKRFGPDEPPLAGWPYKRVDAAMKAITGVVIHPVITGSIKELRESLADLQGEFEGMDRSLRESGAEIQRLNGIINSYH